MKICIGMISYLPDNNMRSTRIKCMQDLFTKLDELFKGIPVMVITQNWKDHCPKTNLELIREDHDKGLGIIQARINLREKFINSDFDYMIMLDDDALIGGSDASDYIREIQEHPNCFGWFSNHLLKLFAISKHVYSQIEMPNISAENFEGFEDKLFISMCRIRFPELEFEFSHDKLTETSYGVNDIPSTWWSTEASKHRKEMKDKTDNLIKEYMKKYNNTSFIIPGDDKQWHIEQAKKAKKLLESTYPPSSEEKMTSSTSNLDEDKIDIVITYVDNQEESWQKLYTEYKTKESKNDSVQSTNIIRFRDTKTLRYLFRSIEQNCKWVNKIFLVVQNEKQIPNWLNTLNKKLRIVYHDEYIPNELLPTFNSNVIEVYLSKIQDLSNKYILFNDDTFVFSPINSNFFFEKDKPVYFKKEISKIRPVDDFYKTICNNQNFLTEILGPHKEYWHAHLQQAHLKEVEQQLLTQYSDKFINSFKSSHFRNTSNLTPWFFDDYLKLTDCGINRDGLYSSSANVQLNEKSKYRLYHNYKLVCVNDSEPNIDIDFCGKKLRLFLNNKFKNKSSYELFDLTKEELNDLQIAKKLKEASPPSDSSRREIPVIKRENQIKEKNVVNVVKVDNNSKNLKDISSVKVNKVINTSNQPKPLTINKPQPTIQNEKIDIVIPYVNVLNKKWQREYRKDRSREYINISKFIEENNIFKDPNTLKYTLRSIEKNCKWVNRIFIIMPDTSHVPEWLNVKNRKIKLLYYDDYIPHQLLPTYNINVVEIFLANIQELSNNYLLCKDTYFFNLPCIESQFFIENKPVYDTSLDILNEEVDSNISLKAYCNINNSYNLPSIIYPHKKPLEKELLLNKNTGGEIRKNFSKSRFEHESNITSKFFTNYLIGKEYGTNKQDIYSLSSDINLDKNTKFDSYSKSKLICINKISGFNYTIKKLHKYLESLFNEKSQFEL